MEGGKKMKLQMEFKKPSVLEKKIRKKQYKIPEKSYI